MNIPSKDCRHLDQALSLEWLETNGRGGFASGTVAGAHTRRYHALLLTARNPPAERVVLVNSVEEWLDLDGHSFPLSTNLYPGVVHPTGYDHCAGFALAPWPVWTYKVGGLTLRRELFCVQGRDLVVLRWHVVGRSKRTGTLRVRPKLTGRDYHALHHENGALRTEATVRDGQVTWQPYPDVPAVRAVHNGRYRHAPDWYRHVQFPVEQQRGLDDREDWWSPGELSFVVAPGSSADLVLSSETVEAVDVARLEQAERSRREARDEAVPSTDALVRRLWVATEAFLSERGSQQTIVAGYPWFTDWGRDAFISLPGLCLVTGRYTIARQVISAFAAHVSDGMIPNRFPDDGEQPEYNTIDASLWFIHAVDRYLAYSKDMGGVRQVWPAMAAILDGYRRGTRYGIHVDHDGLVTGGEPGAQLTWMDAKVGEWVVTPRQGKPVEIQALWIRALAVGEMLAKKFRDKAQAERCRRDRALATESFQRRFWYGAGGYLYDVIDGPEGDDASLRPNQLYALALCDGLVAKEQAQQILRVVEEHLLTPVGLRTLSPHDPRYRGRYDGGVAERDGAYHQGTVWPFLMGPFVSAWLKTYGQTVKNRARARTWLNGLVPHLEQACVGQVSEIFDGDPPHEARGCIAQAWSVAEPLRVLIEELGVIRAAGGCVPARPRT
ncbi:MAG: amylo-alpha-1,6-glucosidase [Nitrospira sp.]|jgi:predicted glycogen debranching enzyme|nr:amylo-alpha-1,6-glucosidase [Nitrospira sp.]